MVAVSHNETEERLVTCCARLTTLLHSGPSHYDCLACYSEFKVGATMIPGILFSDVIVSGAHHASYQPIVPVFNVSFLRLWSAPSFEPLAMRDYAGGLVIAGRVK